MRLLVLLPLVSFIAFWYYPFLFCSKIYGSFFVWRVLTFYIPLLSLVYLITTCSISKTDLISDSTRHLALEDIEEQNDDYLVSKTSVISRLMDIFVSKQIRLITDN